MKLWTKALLWLMGILALFYAAVCLFFYFAQDKIIFPAHKLTADYQFEFTYPFKEYAIPNGKDTLSGILFKAYETKGLIFYLHGNGGALDTWGTIAPAYTQMGYDIFMLDYPGYGKSTGNIENEQDLLKAVQTAYDTIKVGYTENQIVVFGFSIGTGAAAWLASHSQPKALVLLAPYYSIADLVNRRYPFLPGFLAKYSFATFKYIERVKAPVHIFHGDEDVVIEHAASIKLQKHFKKGDQLVILEGQGHNNIQNNKVYLSKLSAILN
ncbi:alpha/beta hydrolase [Mucilaginibacter hurinus]|uniref:Alpha/beta hydrolase n=1 Tax=Mucilaginibacter hurinus TaxID=2201324 RepID=A0A367GT34_9SPHI|nr:alpha/beta fold hydrolase [Mucilaginibacter hurinus]RCH56582.1 alpha/beta hydrolase [Mucilaginibacter hurinus]